MVKPIIVVVIVFLLAFILSTSRSITTLKNPSVFLNRFTKSVRTASIGFSSNMRRMRSRFYSSISSSGSSGGGWGGK